MTDSERIPYVGYGNTGHISQEIAETIHTSEYWKNKYLNTEQDFFTLKYMFNENMDLRQKEFEIYDKNKKRSDRIISVLFLTCVFMGLVIFWRLI